MDSRSELIERNHTNATTHSEVEIRSGPIVSYVRGTCRTSLSYYIIIPDSSSSQPRGRSRSRDHSRDPRLTARDRSSTRRPTKRHRSRSPSPSGGRREKKARPSLGRLEDEDVRTITTASIPLFMTLISTSTPYPIADELDQAVSDSWDFGEVKKDVKAKITNDARSVVCAAALCGRDIDSL